MSISELLQQLRNLMQNVDCVPEALDAYIVPSEDEYNTEIVGEADQRRAFITGFHGTYGTGVVLMDKALLWTDGRYHLQCEQELDQNWTLMKEGLPDTPSRGQWLASNLPGGSLVGVDPRLISYTEFTEIREKLERTHKKLLAVETNLIDLIWRNRPARPVNPVICLPLIVTGINIDDKLYGIRRKMSAERVTALLLSSLDEIAWLLNVRGTDIDYNQVFYAYVIVELFTMYIFMNIRQYNQEIVHHIKNQYPTLEYNVRPYEKIVETLSFVATSNVGGITWVSGTSNYALVRLVPESRMLLKASPVLTTKYKKSDAEVVAFRNAYKSESIAMVCFFFWLEQTVGKEVVTEMTAAEKLEEFRQRQGVFKGPSFPTVSAVGAHAALPHYKPTPQTDANITKDSLYLCNCGAHYAGATTDISRTVHFGEPTPFEKECYTRVLKGQLQVLGGLFPEGVKGNNLDGLMRRYLWDVGLDCVHDTGHGIGARLFVHEGPFGMSSWRKMPEDPGLEESMVVAVEPGCYLEGQFGIRIGDVAVVMKSSDHGTEKKVFLEFDNITYVPIQKKMIDLDLLTEKEVEILNRYHRKCIQGIGRLMERQHEFDALTWFVQNTQPILK